MKAFILTIFSILLMYECSAQNLVNNPGFESMTGCPQSVGQIDHAIGWNSWNVDPDLFHGCNTFPGPFPGMVGIPASWFGYQYPRSGNAYGGFVSYSPGDLREAIGTQLNQPLIIGQKYFVKFFVSRAHSLVNGGFWDLIAGTNKLGALFSTIPYSASVNPSPVHNFAHVYSDSLIADTTNWVLISGSFIADSAYTYVGFGNFFNDSATTVAVYGIVNPYEAYYYIDDISVSPDSLYTTGISQIDPVDNSILYPNPFNEYLNISTHDQLKSEILLYDIVGKIVLKREFTNFAKISTADLVNGIYIYEIRNENGVIRNGKIVKGKEQEDSR